jgi:HAD superfamily hydrolase (TIGR01509 family)
MNMEAVIFDFDGVIADTEPLHFRSFQQVIGAAGMRCSWEEYVRDFIGFDDRDLFRAAHAKLGLPLCDADVRRLVAAKAEAFMALTREGVPVYEGVPEVVHAAAERFPVAICSGALRSDIEPILAQLGLTDTLSVRVTAEDVVASKPDPTCYRLAVERLSVASGRALRAGGCLAIEDTPTGIKAAHDAGLMVWAVSHTHHTQQLLDADRIFSSLPEIIQAWATA